MNLRFSIIKILQGKKAEEEAGTIKNKIVLVVAVASLDPYLDGM